MSSESNKSKSISSDLKPLAITILGGILLLPVILFFTNTNKPKETKPAKVQVTPGNVISPSAPQSTSTNNDKNLVDVDNSTVKRDYIKDIINLDSITVDGNFSHLLRVTITNPYDKSISNVQVYLGYDGNVYIPSDISEDSPQLINMKIQIPPNSHESYTIATNDNGVANRRYVVSVRKIRFTDGTSVEP